MVFVLCYVEVCDVWLILVEIVWFVDVVCVNWV